MIDDYCRRFNQSRGAFEMIDRGWICPKCQCVYAPYVPNCFKCNEKPNFDAHRERAKIVAWLRGQGEHGSERAQVWGESFAKEIEAGEHLK